MRRKPITPLTVSVVLMVALAAMFVRGAAPTASPEYMEPRSSGESTRGLDQLLDTAIRSSQFVQGNGAQATLFTSPAGQRTFVTSINVCCAANQTVTIEIAGSIVLGLGPEPAFWSTGGGAPLVLEPGETLTVTTTPGLFEAVEVTATAFRLPL